MAENFHNLGKETDIQIHDDPKPMGCSRSSSKRVVYSSTILPQETRKLSNKQPNLTPKATRERRTNKTQS